ncbi:pyruvate dehydrogenase complex dihydrolipoamide acetyltransferase [Gracilimonas sp.]|uniref:pyruvate dehydrogenase complex dihydrolipoamide acetyltransferase n=1 Tax=Gracilimonas sp. TaxID=1974203 RepID=UPI002871DAD7|nr:pyruvate dehydrogenase complex dihydrolipoamide acetyltransferase [Gracilimonas sp.]
MAIKIEMPKLSDTMEEGVIASWNVNQGDQVEPGDIIAEVETDKATMEVEAFDAGTVLKILVDEGDAVPLGGLMAVLGEEGEDISEILENAGSSSSDNTEEKAESKSEEKEESTSGSSNRATLTSPKSERSSADSDDIAASTGKHGRILASPLARKMAEDKGIELENVSGSGPNGRIIKADIEDYKEEAPTAVSTPAQTFESIESKEVKVSQMRKTIARRLSESKFTSPHFYETIDIDMKAVVAARKQINDTNEDVKISFNDIVVKACATALTRHQYVNSSWHDDVIKQHGDIHVAVAVAIEEGLMTPVIRHTDKKGLAQISSETRELAGLARERKLQPEQMEGSTFTISNLGMFGIEEFTAIINPPNACILAVGAIRDVPVVENGEVVPGKRMKVTLSSDHRIVDGAKAAEFLNTVKNLLENPLSMLL